MHDNIPKIPLRNEKALRGQVFLGVILLVGFMVVMVGLLLVFLATSLVNTSYGVKISAITDAAATAGAEDAILQLDRGSFASFPLTYTIPVQNTTAAVSVASNVPSAGFYTVTSTAAFGGHVRVLKVVLSVVASTTQVNVVSWQDIQ